MKAPSSPVPTHTRLRERVLGVTGAKPPPHFLVLGTKPPNGSPSKMKRTLRVKEEPQAPTSRPRSVSAPLQPPQRLLNTQQDFLGQQAG